MKDRIGQNLLNLLVMGICVVVTLLGIISTQSVEDNKNQIPIVLEQTWREQARTTLANVRVEFLAGVKEGTINPLDDASVQKWASVYYSGLRNGGSTSDGFIIRMPTGKFMWDGSPDCATLDLATQGRYIKGEAPKHKNPSLAEKVYLAMSNMHSTREGDNQYWQYDDATEYLEWAVVPNDTNGIDDEPMTIGGAINPKYNSFIFTLGTQSDEVLKPYLHIQKGADTSINEIKIVSVLSVIICLLNMMIYVYLTKKKGDNIKC